MTIFKEDESIVEEAVVVGFNTEENKERCRWQWLHGLRYGLSSPARILRSWVRIPLEAWMFV
jgi:hypothetical protein